MNSQLDELAAATPDFDFSGVTSHPFLDLYDDISGDLPEDGLDEELETLFGGSRTPPQADGPQGDIVAARSISSQTGPLADCNTNEELTFDSPDIKEELLEPATEENRQPLKRKQNQDAPTDPKLRLRITRKKARERKKEMMDTMQQDVERLSQHVNALTIENERLKNRNGILESIVQYLEEYMALKAVKSQQNVPQVGPPSQLPPMPMRTTTSIEQSPLAYLQSATNLPPATVSNLLAVDFKTLTPDQVIAAWKMYIAQASVWVLQAEAQAVPSPDVLANISALNTEFLAFVKGLAAENVDALQGAQLLNLQSATLPISEDQHWRNVAGSLDLTPQQCTQIYVARDLFLAATKKYSAERSSLSSMLQDAIQALTNMALSTPTDSAALMEDRVVSQMKANLKRQSITYLAFSFFVIERIFTPLQFAKMFVHSHPFFASPLTLMNIITGCSEPAPAAGSAAIPAACAPPAPSPLSLLSFLSAPTTGLSLAGSGAGSFGSQPSSGSTGGPAGATLQADALLQAAAANPQSMADLNFFPALPASWAPASAPATSSWG